ncbi:flagellar hook-associated protein FlgL [Psychrobacillus sp. MER TA 171]|uniref:flagellar hook-associated protein FlgL n=1 Tax=Psychrobacillus sp. MER TA 171 TaxID=2939577 RepID=UPI00203B2A16|nr:flagellar hook-associated protein FlgL [Psychrobacillus sp. MER TA 171]MCM3356754.1 flagellar hook-associated protein FlgL [Psychrobacillus sp. MER TA 171]
MRVTQSMLSNNMLRNLSNSYNKMGKVQNQIETGKKVTRPSDDPVVAMKGIGYRTALDKVEQFQRNIGEVNNWLDSSDDAFDKVGSALQRANELAVKAANGTTTVDDQEKIKSELDQLRQHIQNIANTKVGDKYIFSGTKTTTAPFDTSANPPAYVELNDAAGNPINQGFIKDVEIEVFDGINLKVNTNAIDVFKNIDQMFQDIKDGTVEFSEAIGKIDKQMNDILTTRADIGARQNRVELMDDRLQSQEVIATKQMSENEDVDMEKAITEMITQESIHRAALSVGARIIQPSLVDFLR